MPNSITEPATQRAVLRHAVPADAPAVSRLLTDSSLPAGEIPALFATDAGDFVVADDPQHTGELLAVAGLEISGAAALLRSVAVRSDLRAHGLGGELVQHTLALADARGVSAVYLLTTTAEHYFPRFGFVVVGREAVPPTIAATLEFRSACPASAVAMVRVARPIADTL